MCTGLFRAAGQVDRLAGGVRARAGDDGDPAGGKLERPANDGAMLFLVERRRLSRGPDGHDGRRPGLDMEVDETPEARVVDAPVLMHGGNEGNDAAAKHVRLR